MSSSADPNPLLQGLNKSDYNITSLEDEIRVDQLCADLLRYFNQHLTQRGKLAPEEAGELCHGADYFLREFIIADRRENLFNIEPARIRQFAGHWYIIRTPEPNMTELQTVLNGTIEFYRFLAHQDLVPKELAGDIDAECLKLVYYQQRIDDFWALEGDGFDAWRQACPLEAVPDIS